MKLAVGIASIVALILFSWFGIFCLVCLFKGDLRFSSIEGEIPCPTSPGPECQSARSAKERASAPKEPYGSPENPVTRPTYRQKTSASPVGDTGEDTRGEISINSFPSIEPTQPFLSFHPGVSEAVGKLYSYDAAQSWDQADEVGLSLLSEALGRAATEEEARALAMDHEDIDRAWGDLWKSIEALHEEKWHRVCEKINAGEGIHITSDERQNALEIGEELVLEIEGEMVTVETAEGHVFAIPFDVRKPEDQAWLVERPEERKHIHEADTLREAIRKAVE